MYFLGCTHLVELDDEQKRRSEQHAATQERSRNMQYVGPRRLFAEFKLGGHVPAHVRDQVASLQGFRTGIGPDEDPYLTRVRYWDSLEAQRDNGWTDEERIQAEQALLASGDANVLRVEDARIVAPYAKYDEHRKVQGRRTIEHVIADITRTYEMAGFDVAQAAAYERQNFGDESVVAAIGRLGVVESVGEPETELIEA